MAEYRNRPTNSTALVDRAGADSIVELTIRRHSALPYFLVSEKQADSVAWQAISHASNNVYVQVHVLCACR